MTKQYQNAIKIAEHLGKAHRMVNKAASTLICWKIHDRFNIEHTPMQKEHLSEARKKLSEAQEIVDQVYAQIIGRAMLQDIKKH